MKKEEKMKENDHGNKVEKPAGNNLQTLKTDDPLIEKDEVKQAEEKMRQAAKKEQH